MEGSYPLYWLVTVLVLVYGVPSISKIKSSTLGELLCWIGEQLMAWSMLLAAGIASLDTLRVLQTDGLVTYTISLATLGFTMGLTCWAKGKEKMNGH